MVSAVSFPLVEFDTSVISMFLVKKSTVSEQSVTINMIFHNIIFLGFLVHLWEYP